MANLFEGAYFEATFGVMSRLISVAETRLPRIKEKSGHRDKRELVAIEREGGNEVSKSRHVIGHGHPGKVRYGCELSSAAAITKRFQNGFKPIP
jgi:hypothetical protein